MLTKEAMMEIKILSRQGMSIRAISRELGVSRNTVRKYLRGEALKPPDRKGPGRPCKLAPYEDWLRQRVSSAQPVRLPATVLHREIAAMGFDGTERTVRRFVASLYPEPEPEAVIRFETAPGHQAQMDWGEYRLNRRKVYAFVGVLGYSRWLYFEYVDSMRSEVLIDCHRRMLADFGGVPREILYDNMKTVVTQRDAYGRGRHRFQEAIWSFAADCGYRPRLCRPARPQTKGKVERSIDYIANSFFHPFVTRLAMEGRVPSLEELNAEARYWCGSVANVRIHGTTGMQPKTRLPVEQTAMLPYSAPPVKPDSAVASRWPCYPLQRSPKVYDAFLREVG
ncbi:IS21 family transposase [Aidingimonas halophila]|uniref:Transposase n=1 Tax=Aidingimonas halophila TaxID=574349 RepID=A0A1H2U1P4_9GAMM|nr:IS21 family transposase [Aidingimonas halophila]GHC38845.1 transposase [Aidingimonas halophila]SDW50096.1 Transposase [Aidingimonas halophila]